MEKRTMNADETITKEQHKVGLTTNKEDWISHAEVDINGDTVISWEHYGEKNSNIFCCNRFING